MSTVYIHPTLTDQGGQCRIYRFDGSTTDARKHIERNPNLWTECGLMNSQGRLVCFSGPPWERDELRNCQPLMAGLTFSF